MIVAGEKTRDKREGHTEDRSMMGSERGAFFVRRCFQVGLEGICLVWSASQFVIVGGGYGLGGARKGTVDRRCKVVHMFSLWEPCRQGNSKQRSRLQESVQ